MQKILAAAGLALAGCAGEQPSSARQPVAQNGGWSIAIAGDLNAFFDCLETAGITLIDAHRGGPKAGYPENAIETFEETQADVPALIEIDLAASADGVLYLMHDDRLERTTNGEGPTDALPWDTIRKLTLKDNLGAPTAFHPPSFADALVWAKGRTILKIDFKRTARYEDVVAEIDRQQAEDRVIFIAYTTAQAKRLHRLAPEAMISLSVRAQSDLNRAAAAGIPAERLLGFTGAEDPKPRLFSILNDQEIEVIFGTLGGGGAIDRRIEQSGEETLYADLAGIGVDIIATDRPVAAQAALNAAGRGAVAGVCGIAQNEG